jgi:hypothetical protein
MRALPQKLSKLRMKLRRFSNTTLARTITTSEESLESLNNATTSKRKTKIMMKMTTTTRETRTWIVMTFEQKRSMTTT